LGNGHFLRKWSINQLLKKSFDVCIGFCFSFERAKETSFEKTAKNF